MRQKIGLKAGKFRNYKHQNVKNNVKFQVPLCRVAKFYWNSPLKTKLIRVGRRLQNSLNVLQIFVRVKIALRNLPEYLNYSFYFSRQILYAFLSINM